MMNNNLEIYNSEIDNFTTTTLEELDAFRLKYLGKKGILIDLFNKIKDIPPENRKDFGKDINILKSKVLEKVEALKNTISQNQCTHTPSLDVSRTANFIKLGARHPISVVTNHICDIFKKIGFSIAEGPDIEDDWHNFESLNFAAEHPARDMQDTFFIDKNILLRTHTSPVQVRVMEKHQPPIRIICPGRVFRNEVITARSHCIFHQIELLYVDENVSFADMRQTLDYFIKETFGSERKTRLRPSYFPFTEPSAEMDISCDICNGKGCNICKHTGWVEILGCGMIDPNVLTNVGIDPNKYSGFAAGIGIERLTQQLYKTKDIRLFFENDIRFIQQFESI